MLTWYNDKPGLTLLLIGGTGYGKTQGALALTAELNPLLVRDINDLKALTAGNKAIIFDDLNISDLEVNQVKHLLDSETRTTHKVLYGTVAVDKGVRKLFLCNTFPYVGGGPDTQAVTRRLYTVDLKESMIKKVTLTKTEVTKTEITKTEVTKVEVEL